jgi:hypothetical protein
MPLVGDQIHGGIVVLAVTMRESGESVMLGDFKDDS